MVLVRSLSRGRNLAGLSLFFVLLSVVWFRFGPAAALTSTGVPLLDSQTAYTTDQAYRQLALYGELGRRQYQIFLAGDFVWALLFGVTAAALLMLALRSVGRDSSPWTWLLFLPWSVVLLDWVENASLLWVTSRFPEPAESVAAVAPLVTTAKLMMVNVTLVALVAAVVTVIVSSTGRILRETT